MTIFLCLLLATAMSSACARTRASSNVADVCGMEDGSFVTVDGFLRLPNFLETRTDPETEVTIYELLIAADPDGETPSIKTRVPGTRGNKANRIAELPADGYTQRDLRIFTSSGETVGASDRIRISGELRKRPVDRELPCVLTTEKIERP